MKLISLLAGLCFVLSTQAQYDGKDSLVASRYRPGIMWFNTGWRPAKTGKPRKYDRFMVDLTYNDWVNDSALFLVKPSSIGFNIHFMWDIPLNEGNGVALGIGLSYRHQHFRYNGDLLRDTANQATKWILYANGQNPHDKAIFGTRAFAVPVELRFRLKKWRHVKLHLGGYIGYRTRSYTKVWQDSGKRPEKNTHFFDAEPLFYGVHARVGIRNWAFFADYSLTPQFQSAKSTSLQPLAFGITLSLF